jgi:hypothetical protein
MPTESGSAQCVAFMNRLALHKHHRTAYFEPGLISFEKLSEVNEV